MPSTYITQDFALLYCFGYRCLENFWIIILLILEQHQKSEREYRQKLAKIRENVKPIETEEDMWRKLDELEFQEELQDELDR